MSMPDFTSSTARSKERIENYLGKDIPGLEQELERYHTNYFLAQMSDSNRIMFAEQAEAKAALVKFIAQYVPEDKAKNIPIS